MFTSVVEIEVHLPSVCIAELANFEVYDERTSQAAVKENEIDTEPSIVNTKPALAAHECKIVAQL